MRAAVAAVDPGRQHQTVQLHDAPNPLPVVAGPEGAIHHRPDAAIAIRRAAVRHGADLSQDGPVVRAVIAAGEARPGHVVGSPPQSPRIAGDQVARRLMPWPKMKEPASFETSLKTSGTAAETARFATNTSPPPMAHHMPRSDRRYHPTGRAA